MFFEKNLPVFIQPRCKSPRCDKHRGILNDKSFHVFLLTITELDRLLGTYNV